MKANPLTALSRQPGLLGRAVLPQLLDIPEQTAQRQVEATMCLHVSAISKCLAHLCSNFGPEQKRTPECMQFWMLTSATNNLNIEESIEKGSNMKDIEIWHPWITNCQWHLPFRAKALGTELLALQLSTRFTYFYPLRVSLWFSWGCQAWSCQHVGMTIICSACLVIFHLLFAPVPRWRPPACTWWQPEKIPSSFMIFTYFHGFKF